MFNITTPDDINTEFSQMVKTGFDEESVEVQAFGRLFWKELSTKNQKLYHWVFPPKTFRFDEDAHKAEGAILSRQEDSGMYD
jgi:hypothetical protein